MTKLNIYTHLDNAGDFSQQVRLNQNKLASELKRHYDFVVCGAGTSGSVVAARLASDPQTQVLLLEVKRERGAANAPNVKKGVRGRCARNLRTHTGPPKQSRRSQETVRPEKDRLASPKPRPFW